MKLHQVVLLSLVLVLALGCNKDDGTVVVPGNTAPPDPTIPTITKESYVNKAYIGLLGREPDPAERSAALQILDKNDLSMDNREEMLDQILTSQDYEVRLYEIARTDLLNALDTNEITQTIAIYQLLLTDSTYMNVWNVLQDEIVRMEALKGITKDLANGTIDNIEVQRRCVHNQFYDDLNMGTENFVVSMFQHFLFRYPTLEELDEGKSMVDGLGGILFLEVGTDKIDFLDIFYASSEYYEGQVRALFLRYLFREPTSQEMADLGKTYEENGDYEALQKAILSLDEYVGL